MKTKLSMAAATAALLVGMPSVAADHNLNLTGYVPQSCSVSPNNKTLNFQNIGDQGSVLGQTFDASFFCNVRFNASLESLNGRFLNTSVPAGDVGTEPSNNYVGTGAGPDVFAALDYSVSSDDLSGLTANSTDWVAGDSIGESDLAPMAGGPIDIDVSLIPLNGSEFLVAGSYSETITLTITPLLW